MKRVIICMTLSFLAGSSISQDVAYKVVEDDPSKVRSKFIAVEWLNADFGGKKNLNTVGVGVNSVWSISESMGAEGRFNFPWAKDENLPFCFQFEAGVFKNLSSSTKVKDVKVRYDGEFDVVENKHVYNEKYIKVPATRLRSNGVRAGLYTFKKGLKIGSDELPYTLTGLYGGWSFIEKTNLVVRASEDLDSKLDDEKGTMFYSGFNRIYLDAIITPVASVTNTFGSKVDLDGQTIIGGRLGFMFYKDGPKFFDKLMWGGEIGYRSVDGFYLNVIAGFSVFRGK